MHLWNFFLRLVPCILVLSSDSPDGPAVSSRGSLLQREYAGQRDDGTKIVTPPSKRLTVDDATAIHDATSPRIKLSTDTRKTVTLSPDADGAESLRENARTMEQELEMKTADLEDSLDTDAERKYMKTVHAHDAHETLLREKEGEFNEECQSWKEEDCGKTMSACSWNADLQKCLKSCDYLSQVQCHERGACLWVEGVVVGSCQLNPYVQPDEGDTRLNKHQGELDEESADGCIPFSRPNYWDPTKHTPYSMEGTLHNRMNSIKHKEEYARCGLDNWTFETDIEIASQMLACRVWRIFFEWVYVQMEKTFDYKADWRHATLDRNLYGSGEDRRKNFYDRIWMLNDANQGSVVESYIFGDKERLAAMYEEHVAPLTTRPIYYKLVDIFTRTMGKGLDPAMPYYGTYGWYHLGRTRDTNYITATVDELIRNIGTGNSAHRDPDRMILRIENYRASLAKKEEIQKYCHRLFLDPRQYSHASFSLGLEHNTTIPPIWNSREEPLSCSLSQVILRLQSWHELGKGYGFTLVDPSPSILHHLEEQDKKSETQLGSTFSVENLQNMLDEEPWMFWSFVVILGGVVLLAILLIARHFMGR